MQDTPLDSDFFDWSDVSENDIVEVRTYPFEQQAQMAKTLLDSEGVPNFLKNANIVSVYSGLSAGLGGIGLMILRKDVTRVLDILAADDEEIEIDENMLTEAMLRDMELEAHEAEQEIKEPFNIRSFFLLIGMIVSFFFALWILFSVF